LIPIMANVSYSNNRRLLLGEDSDSAKGQSRRTEISREQHLMQAHNEMETELYRLKSTAAVISDTSATIMSINSQYGLYQSRLVSAASALKSLKKKMKSDDSFIYWSYLAFLLTAGWIFLKRVRVVGAVHWLTSKGFYGANYIFQFIEEANTTDVSPATQTHTVTSPPVMQESTASRKPNHTVVLTRSRSFLTTESGVPTPTEVIPDTYAETTSEYTIDLIHDNDEGSTVSSDPITGAKSASPFSSNSFEGGAADNDGIITDTDETYDIPSGRHFTGRTTLTGVSLRVNETQGSSTGIPDGASANVSVKSGYHDGDTHTFSDTDVSGRVPEFVTPGPQRKTPMEVTEEEISSSLTSPQVESPVHGVSSNDSGETYPGTNPELPNTQGKPGDFKVDIGPDIQTSSSEDVDDDLPEPTELHHEQTWIPTGPEHTWRSHSLTTTPHAKTNTPQRPLPPPQRDDL
jgi:hypothetical protein